MARDESRASKRKAPKGKSNLTERQTEALRLRYRRLTYQEIADKLYKGNSGNAHADIHAALKVVQKDEADDVRQMEMQLLDDVMRPQIVAALQGDAKAYDRVLRGMARRSAYMGLDAPKDLNLPGNGTVIVEFDSSLSITRRSEPELEVPGDDD